MQRIDGALYFTVEEGRLFAWENRADRAAMALRTRAQAAVCTSTYPSYFS
jgi:hypothetical protein